MTTKVENERHMRDVYNLIVSNPAYNNSKYISKHLGISTTAACGALYGLYKNKVLERIKISNAGVGPRWQYKVKKLNAKIGYKRGSKRVKSQIVESSVNALITIQYGNNQSVTFTAVEAREVMTQLAEIFLKH